MLTFWLSYCTIILPHVTIGRNWIKGAQDLSVIFLAAACESIVLSKEVH